MKIIKVESCIHCPYLTTDPNSKNGALMCRLSGGRIEPWELSEDRIDEECPLEDE